MRGSYSCISDTRYNTPARADADTWLTLNSRAVKMSHYRWVLRKLGTFRPAHCNAPHVTLIHGPQYMVSRQLWEASVLESKVPSADKAPPSIIGARASIM